MTAPPIDVFPKSGSALIGTADRDYLTQIDFNGTARGDRADVGAYLFDANGNPGWTIMEGFKMTSECECDFDFSGGVDGLDLDNLINGATGFTLEDFVPCFGAKL
jgi:hypothetical protein